VPGDGDFLTGANALWTAARHDLPMLVVVDNDLAAPARSPGLRGRGPVTDPAEPDGVLAAAAGEAETEAVVVDVRTTGRHA
jgi:thiamine pyrophosphate-dependent acetolactate synthase large subunit-like protein